MRPRPISTPLFLATFAATLAIAALEAAPVIADELPSVDAIVRKSLEARGGRDAWKAIETAKLTGKTEISGGGSGTFTLWVKRPMKMRFEVEMPGLSLVQAFDGDAGWAIFPGPGGRPGKPQPLEDDQIQQLRDMADIDGPLVDYRAKGNQVELVGEDEVEGRAAYELEVTKPSGQVVHTFVDAETYLPVRDVLTAKRPEGDLTVDVAYRDYKTVAGVRLAHTLVQSVEGTQAQQTITVDGVTANVDVPDSMFAFPGSTP